MLLYYKDIEPKVQSIIDQREDIPFINPVTSKNVVKDVDDLTIKNTRIDKYSYINSRGLSEYDGNSSYTQTGVGLYFNSFTEKTLVKVIKFRIHAPASFEGNLSIYKGNSLSADTSNHTLIESKTYTANEFNTDSNEFAQFVLSEHQVLDVGDYLYILLETTNAQKPTIKRWTENTVDEPYRNQLLFKTTGDWLFGAGTHLGTDVILLAEPESDFNGLEQRVSDLESNMSSKLLPQITIPDNIYAVVGVDFNLYYDNLVYSMDRGLQSPLGVNVEVICAKGQMTERAYRLSAVSEDVGAHSLDINVYDYNKNVISSKSVTLNILEAVAPSSISNVLFIGDSLTANGNIPEKVRDHFVTLGSNIPVLYGSQDSAPNNDEGRPGWTFAAFVGASSPFWNGSVIDIAYYRNNVLSSAPVFDYVSIQLGVNESLSGENSESELTAIIDNAKALVDAFIADNASTIITLQLPTIDCNTKGGWASNYDATRSKEVYQKNIRALRQLILSEFDNGIYNSNVKIGIAGLGIDRYYGYPRTTEVVSSRHSETIEKHTNAVHPNYEGYLEISDIIFPQMLNEVSS